MLKVLTLNIWNYEGPWQQRLSLIRSWINLLQPDLIALQEVLKGEDYDQAGEIFAETDYQHVYAGPMKYWNDESLQFGNLVASRWPIVDHRAVLLPMAGKVDRRVLLATTIDAPFGPISFNCTHLSAQPQHGFIREQQVEMIARVIRQRIPDIRYPAILCGDMNATPESAEIRFLKGLQSMAGASFFMNDAWEIAGDTGPGYTFTPDNAYLRGKIAYRKRLDYILSGRAIAGIGAIKHCRLACHIPHNDTWPSDHFGLYAELTTE